MTQALNERAIDVLHFAADMKAVSYTHIAQYIAPNFEPAIDEPLDPDKKRGRGGNQRNAPWPRDRRKRIKAVSQLVDKWEDAGLVQSERPWLDRPMWVWVTMAGLRRLGLSYNEAHFYDDEEELTHLYQITRVRLLVACRPQDPGAAWFKHTWVSERAIKAGYPQHTPGTVLAHLPDGAMELDEDAFVKMADGELQPFRRGDRLAVEIERSRKDFHRLDVILPDLLKHYVGVWYFCRPKAADAVLKTRERLVKEGTLSVAQSKLIRVLDLAETEELGGVMAFKDRVHLLSDQLEGDAPIAWRRDWPSLLALSLVTLLTGPWPVLALWVQRWNVRTLWDAKDHWEGTKQFAITFVIIGILSVIALIQFQPALSLLGPHNNWSWLFYHTLFWWFWWALLTPTFALIAERVDPRTQRIRRVFLPQERPPAPQSAASGKAVTQSSGKKKAARPKKNGRPVPLGILLAEEKAEMERRRTQINYIQPSLPSREGIEASPVPEISLPLPAETASPLEPPKSKKQPERRKPESLDNLF